ncbi:MAG: VanZ family protein [Muribaculaceae bacterium]|nr:VanZ family protein [Muribaculaceae bacterium]
MKSFLRQIPVGVPSLIITALVIYLSLAHDPFHTSELPLFPGADKWAHVVMYIAVTAVYMLDYAKHKLPHHPKLNVDLALTSSASVLGLLMEVGQLIMHNGRGFEWADWTADTMGAIIGLLLVRYWFMHHFRTYFLGRRHHAHHAFARRRKRSRRHSRHSH